MAWLWCSSFLWGFTASLPSVCVYHSLSANINPSIQPLEFPKYACEDWAVLLCLDEDELVLGQYSSAWFSWSGTSLLWSFSYLLVCKLWFGLLTNGDLAPFLTPSLWLGRFYELLLVTSSLWPQGVLMSCSKNFCEWNRVEEGGIYSVGESLWCWHLFAYIWWLRCLVTVWNHLSSLDFSSDTWKSCIC
jgi:hypothetical protein